MKRLSINIAVLFLTFICGIAAAKTYFILNIQFEVTGAGSFSVCEDGQGGFTTLKSYDGERLEFYEAKFSSAESSKDCFEMRLQDAAQIIEREPTLDKSGEKIVGERIIALYSPPQAVVNRAAVITLLDEDKIYTIASASLRHALIYEERNRKY